jgi:hypothetical protein
MSSVGQLGLCCYALHTMARSRSSRTKDGQRSIRSALKDAADEAQRRRRLVRGALISLSGALILLGSLLLGGPK